MLKKELLELEEKIKKAQEECKPIEKYILRQIEILKLSLEEFRKESGLSDNDITLCETELRQYAVMKQLAQKANLPIKEYDDLIANVQIRIFGESNYAKLFKE